MSAYPRCIVMHEPQLNPSCCQGPFADTLLPSQLLCRTKPVPERCFLAVPAQPSAISCPTPVR
jgi:hypothetical protein